MDELKLIDATIINEAIKGLPNMTSAKSQIQEALDILYFDIKLNSIGKFGLLTYNTQQATQYNPVVIDFKTFNKDIEEHNNKVKYVIKLNKELSKKGTEKPKSNKI